MASEIREKHMIDVVEMSRNRRPKFFNAKKMKHPISLIEVIRIAGE